MIASLQAYDLPECTTATNAFWAALAERLGQPIGLTRFPHWQDAWKPPGPLFSQTCGYPLTHELAGKLKPVATPHYKAEGCMGPTYCSIIMSCKASNLSEFRGQIAAYNTRDSMSGMLALKAVFAPLASNGQFFGSALETGSHLASLAAVQKGKAHVAAIDCVTVALLRRYRPGALAGLLEVGRSQQVPALPYVTGSNDVGPLRAALASVFADSKLAGVREDLLLEGYSHLETDDYRSILDLEAEVERLGGLKLW